MEPIKISERTRRQLDALPPEKRAAAEAVIARTQTPEYRAREVAEREAIRQEFLETGRVAVTPAEVWDDLKEFLSAMRREREARGLSLADVANKSGIDKAALSRLENGQQPNPTLGTVERYARAIGKRLQWSFNDPPVESAASTK
jgi:ribosome-binding protein aMBF1 (putative translation factor)